jgi:ribosome-binding protein aMBF1 (putative translation factor)
VKDELPLGDNGLPLQPKPLPSSAADPRRHTDFLRRSRQSSKEGRSREVRTDLQKFGRRVRHFREMLDVSEEELAERARIPVCNLENLEEGELDTRLSVICRLTRALEVSPARLFEDDDPNDEFRSS